MDKIKFQNLLAHFKGHHTSRHFGPSEWNDSVDKWLVYKNEIEAGLKFDRWVKENNSTDYLPNFLDTIETHFGHARIGNYDQVMIYKFTGKDKNKSDDEKRTGKYIDFYQDGKNRISKTKDNAEQDYKVNIAPLLQEIVKANDLNAAYAIEREAGGKFEKFVCKQILRKMFILMSVDGKSPDCFKNAFLWMFNEKSLKNLSNVLDLSYDDDKTFLENNYDIYKYIKDNLADFNQDTTNDDYVALYDMLWSLSDPGLNMDALSDIDNPNVIFNGAPGTGKSHGIITGLTILKNMKPDGFYGFYEYIQFHPTYSYQDFIEGIKPVGFANGAPTLEVTNGSFKDFCIKVCTENEKFYENYKKSHGGAEPKKEEYKHHFFVVDEINRGNLSKIFGETFTLLEPDYRDYKFDKDYSTDDKGLVSTPLSGVISSLIEKDPTAYSKLAYKIGKDKKVLFGIPFNIHFIGAMNDVDRSIDAFDLALRRRFKWIEKHCDYDVIENKLLENKDPKYSKESVKSFVESCEDLNDFICGNKDSVKNGLHLGQTYEIGHAFFLKITKIAKKQTISKANMKDLFDMYILGTLKEYIRQVKDESEIDNYIVLAKKAFDIE